MSNLRIFLNLLVVLSGLSVVGVANAEDKYFLDSNFPVDIITFHTAEKSPTQPMTVLVNFEIQKYKGTQILVKQEDALEVRTAMVRIVNMREVNSTSSSVRVRENLTLQLTPKPFIPIPASSKYQITYAYFIGSLLQYYRINVVVGVAPNEDGTENKYTVDSVSVDANASAPLSDPLKKLGPRLTQDIRENGLTGETTVQLLYLKSNLTDENVLQMKEFLITTGITEWKEVSERFEMGAGTLSLNLLARVLSKAAIVSIEAR